MLREMVSRCAMTAPERIAVVAGGYRLSYAELDAAASRLTAALRDRGIGPGAMVALYLPRGADIVVGVLGVLGCGAAYTVVEDDGETDEQRLRVTGLGADAVVTTPAQLDWARTCWLTAVATQTEVTERTPNTGQAAGTGAETLDLSLPDSPAYVSYTSGSSGIPKGVVVTHRNIHHYVTALLARLRIVEPLSYANATTFSADLGNTCLFLPLWTGGTVHVLGDEVRRDPAVFFEYLRSERIDVLKLTPSYWAALFRAATPFERPLLRHLILGGERLTPQLAADTLRCGITPTLTNHYGPTETTVGAAAYVLTDVRQLETVPADSSVPVGRPLGSTTFLVRTAAGVIAPSGIGELYIGGPQVAAGYRDDPQRTAASFVTDLRTGDGLPGEGGVRTRDQVRPGEGGVYYRTGDLVRIDDDGIAVFLGRTDRQVKVDGHRVELEHVEAVLRRCNGIADAAVFHLPVGTGHALVAAITPALDPDTVRLRVASMLPRHAVPARVVPVAGGFPHTANGKLDLRRLRAVVEAALATPPPPDDPGDQVRAVWRRYLGQVALADDTDFFAAGGSSLDAIQVIADLQALGYRITARSFLAEPTLAALAAAVACAGGPAPERRADAGSANPGTAARLFSPAQQAFLDARYADPDHWNQAIGLQTPSADPVALAAAVADLVDTHALLHTAFRRTEEGWLAELVAAPEVFSTSQVEGDLAAHVHRVARRLHHGMDLAAGRVFAVHLARVADGPDQILLVAHHLCIDAVSWRILLSDLRRGYAARLRGDRPEVPLQPASFWEWTAHLADYGPALSADFDRWSAMSTPAASAPAGRWPPPRREAGANREADAETGWTALSVAETELLADALAGAGLSMPAAVLAAFLGTRTMTRRRQRDDRVTVDVESHGRATFDDGIDVSRVVGWFTATYPVTLALVPDTAAVARDVTTALETVPDLGIGYGVRGTPATAAPILYNFLGRFNFGADEELPLAVSRLAIGPARGGANDRGYELKLTARIVDGQLVIDLSYHPGRDDRDAVRAALGDTRRALLALDGGADRDRADRGRADRDRADRGRAERGMAERGGTHGGATAGEERVVVEAGTSSGLLAYAPASLRLETPDDARRRYRSVVLTGATGYLGSHVLRLLATAGVDVHCLVRADDDAAATRRLAEGYTWYFGALPPGNVTAYASDLTRGDLGLDPRVYRSLAVRTDAIYHFAADTRLFAAEAAVLRTNVESVRSVLRLAATGRPKDLHHASTLAVAGVVDRPYPVRFTEESLDVGQEFRNAYERSKYVGEQAVHEFVAEGGRAFIYRAGNVSGHSCTGRFQRNGAANRFVQSMRAVIRTGQLPRDLHGGIALSPVDVVAEAIVAISTRAALGGGTFHVDTPFEVAYRDVFAAVSAAGYPLRTTAARDFVELFGEHPDPSDPDIALGLLWAGRREGGVIVDRSRTLRLLADLGVWFPPLDQRWLGRFVDHLAAEGHLAALARSQLM